VDNLLIDMTEQMEKKKCPRTKLAAVVAMGIPERHGSAKSGHISI
jgi:hypothetical protein